MDAPDEMVEAVARIAPEPNGNGEHLVEMLLGGHRHCAWLSGSPRLIAALAEVFARDAKVREIVQRMRGLQAAARPIMRPPLAEIAANDIAALYPSPGDGWGVWGEDDIPARLISEEQR